MTIRPKNEHPDELTDTRSMLKMRALRLRRSAVESRQLLKVKRQILQRLIQRLS
jgi:hypothetical protein